MSESERELQGLDLPAREVPGPECLWKGCRSQTGGRSCRRGERRLGRRPAPISLVSSNLWRWCRQNRGGVRGTTVAPPWHPLAPPGTIVAPSGTTLRTRVGMVQNPGDSRRARSVSDWSPQALAASAPPVANGPGSPGTKCYLPHSGLEPGPGVLPGFEPCPRWQWAQRANACGVRCSANAVIHDNRVDWSALSISARDTG